MALTPYATYADMQARYGEDQLDQLTPKPADYDPEDPPDEYGPEAYWTEKLIASAGEINSVLSGAGYTSVPVTDATQLENIGSKLREVNIELAIQLGGMLAAISESTPITEAVNRARAWLQGVAEGNPRLPLPVAAVFAAAATPIAGTTACYSPSIVSIIQANRFVSDR